MTMANNTEHPPVETNVYQPGLLWAEDEYEESEGDDDYYDSSVIWID